MSETIIFVQVHGRPEILETKVPAKPTLSHLHEALAAVGVEIDAETFIFIDEEEDYIRGNLHEHVHTLVRGVRVHVCRCNRIKTTVHFVNKTVERTFPPGIRVRAVKAWAAREFKLDAKDAAEHVLQICTATERPPSDTPLNQLVDARGCSVCFDLVPEKRVEG